MATQLTVDDDLAGNEHFAVAQWAATCFWTTSHSEALAAGAPRPWPPPPLGAGLVKGASTLGGLPSRLLVESSGKLLAPP